MANDNLRPMIERYKRELMEYNKKISSSAPLDSSVSEAKMQVLRVAEEKSVPVIASPDSVSVEVNAENKNADGSDNTERIFPSTGLTQIPQNGNEPVRSAPPVASNNEVITMPGNAVNNVSNNRLPNNTVNNPPVQAPGPVREEIPPNNGRRIVTGTDEYPPYNSGAGPQYENFDAFLQDNTKVGLLRVQVYASNRVFPINNALVTVSKRIGDEDRVLYSEYTDSSGVVHGLSLPAPDKNLSSYPTALMPYSTYDITVDHPNFSKAIFRNCAIFDGIETTQNCELVPLENASGNNVITYNEEPNG